MKLKNLTMAIMVASLGVASIAAQAETSYYGSMRIGIQSVDDGNDTTTSFTNWYSRMGFKGETDLENGLTAFGHYEFSVDTDNADNSNGALGTRKAYIGLKGDFGRVRIGSDYHTFYNYGTVYTDNAWDGTCKGCGGRTGEALSYNHKIGGVGIGATAYLNDDDLGDGYELGANYEMAGVAFGAAIRDIDANLSGNAEPEPTYAIGGKGKAGPVEVALGYTTQKDAQDTVDLWLKYNDVFFSYNQADLDGSDTKPTAFTIGYTHSIGPKTLMWFEASSSDADDGSDDVTALKAALKYDF